MTFDPFSYPGPSSGGARPRDSAVGGGRSGGAQSQAHRDPIAWAYDPCAQTDCDHHSRVDRPRAADRTASPHTGRSDPYDYGPAPRAKGPYDYGSDPRVEDFYDDRPDPDYSRRGPRRTHSYRKLRTTAKLLSILLYARRLESSYYGPGPHGPAPYDYGPGPVPWEPYRGPYPYRCPPRPLYQYPPRFVPYRYALRRKSKAAAGLLGIFLGCIGAHNFYLGHTGKALAQLLMTLLSVGLFAPVSALWGFSEGIAILCARPGQPPWGVDARGVPLTS